MSDEITVFSNGWVVTHKGFVKAEILDSRYLGVIYPKSGEACEIELCLISVKQSYPTLDLTQHDQQEPGTQSYYLVQLPKRDKLRPKGHCPINPSHLSNPSTKCFLLFEDAKHAFEQARP